MSDSAETRINRLEMQVVALEQQVHDVREDVRTLENVKERLARIEEQVSQVKEGVASLGNVIVEDRNAARKRGEKMAEELQELRDQQAADQKAGRRDLRNAAVGLATTVVTVGAGAIIAIVTHAPS